MRKFLQAFGPMLAIGASSYFVLSVFLSDILLSVAFAIGGETFFFIPWLLMLMAAYIVIMLVFWTILKGRDGTSRREYVTAIGGEVYDRRADGRRISRDGQYRAELVAYAVIATLEILLGFNVYYWPICFPIMYGIFHIYNRQLWYRLHKTWAEERMRLNPNGTEPNA